MDLLQLHVHWMVWKDQEANDEDVVEGDGKDVEID